MATRAVHLTITGRVHGVGYRAWIEDEAMERGLIGLGAEPARRQCRGGPLRR